MSLSTTLYPGIPFLPQTFLNKQHRRGGIRLQPGQPAVCPVSDGRYPDHGPGVNRPQAVPHRLLQPPGGLAVRDGGNGTGHYIRGGPA